MHVSLYGDVGKSVRLHGEFRSKLSLLDALCKAIRNAHACAETRCTVSYIGIISNCSYSEREHACMEKKNGSVVYWYACVHALRVN